MASVINQTQQKLSAVFYTPDTLPVTQPTASKHLLYRVYIQLPD